MSLWFIWFCKYRFKHAFNCLYFLKHYTVAIWIQIDGNTNLQPYATRPRLGSSPKSKIGCFISEGS